MRRWWAHGMSWEEFNAAYGEREGSNHYWWRPQKSNYRKFLLRYANRKTRRELKDSLRKDLDEVETAKGNYHHKIFDFWWNWD